MNNLLIIKSGNFIREPDGSLSCLENTIRLLYPSCNIKCLILESSNKFTFELPDLVQFPVTDWNIFVAIDERGLNYTRSQLYSNLKSRGYKGCNIIAPGAFIGPEVKLIENCYIGFGSIVVAGAKIGMNTIIEDKSYIGTDVKLGNNVYVGVNAIINSNSTLGAFSVIGPNVKLDSNSNIGRYCELMAQINYPLKVKDRTYFLPHLSEGAITIN